MSLVIYKGLRYRGILPPTVTKNKYDTWNISAHKPNKVSGLQPVPAILTHVYIKSQISFSWNENQVTLPEEEICFLGAWNRTQTVKASGSWKRNGLTHLTEGRKLWRGENKQNNHKT